MSQEVGSYDNECGITSLCISELYGKLTPIALMGSADSKLKLVQSGKLLFSMPTSSQPSYLYPYRKSSSDINDIYYLQGTLLGNMGLINLEKENGPKLLWELESTKKSEVVAIKNFDLNYDG